MAILRVADTLTKQRDYSQEELQRTISIENKHTSYCYKNCGLLHLSTQTFPKKIIVNHLINGENRRKSKTLPAQRWKNQSAICNDVIGQNWSRGPCPTPPGKRARGKVTPWHLSYSLWAARHERCEPTKSTKSAGATPPQSLRISLSGALPPLSSAVASAWCSINSNSNN